MVQQQAPLTAYDVLGVHPAAPSELINACYWLVTKELQARRGNDPRMDRLLHHVTRAYETLADPSRRTAYDMAIGNDEEPLVNRPLPRVTFIGRLLGKLAVFSNQTTPYEVLGLQPTAMRGAIPEGYRIMRDQYLRLPLESRRRKVLLKMLEDSYATLSDPEKRAQVDATLDLHTASASSGNGATPAASAVADPISKPTAVESPIQTQPAASASIEPSVAATSAPSVSQPKPKASSGRGAGSGALGVVRGVFSGIWFVLRAAGRAASSIVSAVANQRARRSGVSRKRRKAVAGPAERVDPDERFLERLAHTVQEVDAHEAGGTASR